MIARRLLLALVLLAAAAAAPPARAADDATAQARTHYDEGLKLFDKREYEGALIEFQKADELKPRPAVLFMMAQCEYFLGRLKEARAHYQRYAEENADGEFVELAKGRIENIDKRPGTFVISTVPDDVTVHIRLEGAPAAAATVGQAPNNFQVPRGRYRIDVTKPQYQGQTRIVDVDLAETKPLFFKLDPIPARLEIETLPLPATLYVNGNRARNPYRQDVLPGHYEIFAEAGEHEPRTLEFNLAPGERKLLIGDNPLKLRYIQRSGRAELLVASSLIGGFIGAGAVAAAIGKDLESPDVASVLLLTGGGIAGVIGGVLIATPLVPRYIPDNRALFVLGTMWMGGAEGAAIGIVWQQVRQHGDPVIQPCPGPGPCRGPIGEQLRAGFIGSLPGLGLGLATGALLADRAPTYGRAALIQSAALGGAIMGALAQMATQWKPYGTGWPYVVQVNDPKTTADDSRFADCPDMTKCAFRDNSVLDLMPGALIGLNVGLTAGLLGAYLPNQSRYGPSWKRVLLIDLAAGGGALAGGIAGCVTNADDCLTNAAPSDAARALSARAALVGAAIGGVAGVLLTRHFDDDVQQPQPTPSVSLNATLVPLRTPDGRTTPALGAFGTF